MFEGPESSFEHLVPPGLYALDCPLGLHVGPDADEVVPGPVVLLDAHACPVDLILPGQFERVDVSVRPGGRLRLEQSLAKTGCVAALEFVSGAQGLLVIPAVSPRQGLLVMTPFFSACILAAVRYVSPRNDTGLFASLNQNR